MSSVSKLSTVGELWGNRTNGGRNLENDFMLANVEKVVKIAAKTFSILNLMFAKYFVFGAVQTCANVVDF